MDRIESIKNKVLNREFINIEEAKELIVVSDK